MCFRNDIAFFEDEYGIDKETQEKWKQHVLGKEKLSKEEEKPYFAGQKVLDEVIMIIEKRVKLVVQEWA